MRMVHYGKERRCPVAAVKNYVVAQYSREDLDEAVGEYRIRNVQS
jgi:hypothetical protein